MNDLRDSFEDVADWCERHLEEHHGREIGMTFGAMLRAYGQLATMRGGSEEKVMARAKVEGLLLLISKYLRDHETRAKQAVNPPGGTLGATSDAKPKMVDYYESSGIHLTVEYDASPPIGPQYDDFG